jgi:hypothetical protein
LVQFWNAHHQLFRYIVQYDSALVGLNVVSLNRPENPGTKEIVD